MSVYTSKVSEFSPAMCCAASFLRLFINSLMHFSSDCCSCVAAQQLEAAKIIRHHAGTALALHLIHSYLFASCSCCQASRDLKRIHGFTAGDDKCDCVSSSRSSARSQEVHEKLFSSSSLRRSKPEEGFFQPACVGLSSVTIATLINQP